MVPKAFSTLSSCAGCVCAGRTLGTNPISQAAVILGVAAAIAVLAAIGASRSLAGDSPIRFDTPRAFEMQGTVALHLLDLNGDGATDALCGSTRAVCPSSSRSLAHRRWRGAHRPDWR